MIDVSVDGHMHTKYCNHATGEMEDYVLAAIDKGLAGIIFLEHLERGINYFETCWLSDEDFDAYLQEGEVLRAKYCGKIKVGLGVEVGYNPDALDEIQTFLSRRSWDRIGVSCHFMPDGDRHLNLVSSQQRNWQPLGELGVDMVIEWYFKRLLEAVQVLPGDVLCHLDAILRHHPEVRVSEANQRLALQLLDAVAANGMSLEVNTSGFVHRGVPYPGRFFLSEAIKRGIPLVAVSDAHRPQDVGRYFDQLAEFA